jgi:hypothetical protein
MYLEPKFNLAVWKKAGGLEVFETFLNKKQDQGIGYYREEESLIDAVVRNQRSTLMENGPEYEIETRYSFEKEILQEDYSELARLVDEPGNPMEQADTVISAQLLSPSGQEIEIAKWDGKTAPESLSDMIGRHRRYAFENTYTDSGL